MVYVTFTRILELTDVRRDMAGYTELEKALSFTINNNINNS